MFERWQDRTRTPRRTHADKQHWTCGVEAWSCVPTSATARPGRRRSSSMCPLAIQRHPLPHPRPESTCSPDPVTSSSVTLAPIFKRRILHHGIRHLILPRRLQFSAVLIAYQVRDRPELVCWGLGTLPVISPQHAWEQVGASCHGLPSLARPATGL